MKGQRKISFSTFSCIFLIILCIFVIIGGVNKDKKLEQSNATIVQKVLQEQRIRLKTEDERISNFNLYDKILEKKDISILVIGDGIAEGQGVEAEQAKWFNVVKKSFNDKYGINATVSLITGGGTTVFRGWSEYCLGDSSKKYDLVFICFGQDNQNFLSISQYQMFYENLIKRVKSNNPNTEIVPMIESYIKVDNDFTKIIKDISNHYGLKYIDTREVFKQSSIEYDKLTADGVYPNAQGYSYYAGAISKLIETNYSDKRSTKYIETNLLYGDTLKLDKFNFATNFENIAGFEKGNGRFLGSALGSSLTFNSNTSLVGISYIKNKNGGKIDVYIDNVLVKVLDTYLPLEVKYEDVISSKLQGNHKITLKISKTKNEKSTGTNITIFGIVTN
ncbi:MAG: SGNH/GDSL hydrolase family protein [Clostridiaceae bacterium]|nr:SGNH/GDSL hydrolase family protein [Clostridiaceae bacterium]